MSSSTSQQSNISICKENYVSRVGATLPSANMLRTLTPYPCNLSHSVQKKVNTLRPQPITVFQEAENERAKKIKQIMVSHLLRSTFDKQFHHLTVNQ